MEKIKHFFYYIFKAKKKGLLTESTDERDFDLGLFGWGKYTPKHTRHEIKTESVKNQRRLNNCVFNASTVQKEPDENVELSVRSLTKIAHELGYIRGDGYSSLRKGQKALYKKGIEEEKNLPTVNFKWKDYLNFHVNYTAAGKHKTGSFWSVSSIDQLYKMLDEGRIVATGLPWFTSFNMGGGFKFPYIIDYNIERKGYKVGSHAVAITGYDTSRDGKRVFTIQNSCGNTWGDHGKFYVEEKYFKDRNLGMYVNMDIKKDIGQFLHEYDGINVKGDEKSSIYHIQHGKKKPYPDWLSYLAFNGKDKGFKTVDQEIIDAVEEGDIMDIKKSYYWSFIEDVKEDKQIDKLLEEINKE